MKSKAKKITVVILVESGIRNGIRFRLSFVEVPKELTSTTNTYVCMSTLFEERGGLMDRKTIFVLVAGANNRLIRIRDIYHLLLSQTPLGNTL